jgi:hypothetical protein
MKKAREVAAIMLVIAYGLLIIYILEVGKNAIHPDIWFWPVFLSAGIVALRHNIIGGLTAGMVAGVAFFYLLSDDFGRLFFTIVGFIAMLFELIPDNNQRIQGEVLETLRVGERPTALLQVRTNEGKVVSLRGTCPPQIFFLKPGDSVDLTYGLGSFEVYQIHSQNPKSGESAIAKEIDLAAEIFHHPV